MNSSNEDDLCMRALHGLDDPKITPIKYDDDELLVSILAQVPSKLPCFEVVPTQVLEAPEPEPQEPTKKKRARRRRRRATPVSEDDEGDEAACAAADLARTSSKADALIEAVDASVARFDGLSASVRALADRQAAEEACAAARAALDAADCTAAAAAQKALDAADARAAAAAAKAARDAI